MDAPEIPVDRVGRALKRTLAIVALLSIALLLRAIPWLANLPLHHDEALYGTWARAIADGSDPLLLIPWVDKPPLVLYLLAATIKLFGVSELSLRVPGMAAGVLTVLATFGLARRVAGVRTAWVAAALVALSPFAILFAPTAFTDGWLTLFLVAAAWAALAGRPGWAGVLLGLACASKQQGVMGVPLVLALVIVGVLDAKARWNAKARSVKREEREGPLPRWDWQPWGLRSCFGAVTYWDSLRWHNRPSYWDQSLQTYGGVVLARLADWPERAVEWARQAGYWFGAWPLTLALLTAGCLAWRSGRPSPNELLGRGRLRPAAVCLAYVAGYLLVHVAFTIQPWDRYLLPILPLVCVLLGQGLAAGWEALKRTRTPRGRARVAGSTAAALAAVLVFAATLGVRAAIPVGSDIGAYRGVAQAARFLAGQPPGATVYFDRIGWHLGYYLYGRPIVRSWYDSPQKLASETARVAGTAGAPSQWLALPQWERSRLPALSAALAARGFSAWPAYEVAGQNGEPDITLYRLEPSLVASSATAGRGDLLEAHP